MRIPLARYGAREICAGFAAGVVLGGGLGLLVHPWLGLVGLLPVVIVAGFFRDPERVPPAGEANVVAPADGTVVDISRVETAPFIDGPAVRVSIFLSVLNAHVNRAPVSGEVKHLAHKPGRYLDARRPESATENESNAIGIVDASRRLKVLVRQISGAIARRIVCDCALDQPVSRGQRIGMIKFGSRTEFYVPAETKFRLSVSVNDKVKAGKTVLGVLE